MKEISCNCGHHFEADLPDIIDLDGNLQSLDEILEGTFLSVQCPRCGHTLKPDVPMRVVQSSREVDFFYVPENNRAEAMRGTLDYDVSASPTFVIGYAELVERLTLMESGLDARAVEVLKYYLLEQALERTETAGDVRILFKECDDDGLLFHIEGMREGEVAASKIPLESYRKVVDNLESHLDRKPLSDLLAPPYVSLNNIFREDEE